ncbi:putative disease resistance RPP13-like protein 1 [Senna tora]|uniref:Putative disease resistance RPP13-like protein 1 n=1 Tax=Senna tora TaxID=362788 RepID=A0A834X969_9FABA|nr:putative disease resistance RPP13-like protein 1 [Senna tora]
MAAELVGGSLLSAFLQVMFDRIASPDVAAFLRGKQSTQDSLQTLKTTLYAVRAVLHDADQKQIRDSAVKNWLDDLKDAVYRADDLIDEISTKAATQDEVGNLFCFSLDFYDRRVRYKIEDIVNRLESILKHKDILATIEARKFYNHIFSKGNEITSMTHHVFCGDDGDFSSISRAKYLRTIIIRKEYGVLMPSDIFSKHKCLRVLSLYKGLSKALPDSVNRLIHLRYLNLSHASIKKLPDTLCDLYNLQTLILRGCDGLTKLPNDMQKLVNLRYLDVSHSRLQAMPRGIGKLKKLYFLSDFVLDKVEGASIMELGGLQNLCNSLKIKNLQNVTNGEEASEARLQDKQSIELLEIIWSDGGDVVSSEDILDHLKPHVNLKFLVIDGYRATIFPNWLGHPFYHNLTHLIFYNCVNCYLLPPLGQLPSLKRLEIEGFHALVKVGPEFYKNDVSSSAPTFPSLELLEFRNMLSWQEWWCSYNANAFPQLRYLTLQGCPRLTDKLPNHLPYLETLRIDGCEQLTASPVLRARAIYISGCRKMEFLRQLHCEHVKSMIIINSCDSLTCLQLDNFLNLEQVIINGCENLKSVLSSKIPLLHLKRIKLIDCPNLTSFPIEGLSAPNIIHLEFVGCYNLKSLLNNMMRLPKLQYISLRDSPGIQWVPVGGLPPNLISLDINHSTFSGICCSMEWQSLHSLTSLSINGRYDRSLQLFPEECLLPPSLTVLSICNYSNLETLDSKGFVHLTSLQELRIRECPKLQRITGQRLPASLTQLNIYRCSLLGEQCRAKNADIWPIMCHIPEIFVDNIRVL